MPKLPFPIIGCPDATLAGEPDDECAICQGAGYVTGIEEDCEVCGGTGFVWEDRS